MTVTTINSFKHGPSIWNNTGNTDLKNTDKAADDETHMMHFNFMFNCKIFCVRKIVALSDKPSEVQHVHHLVFEAANRSKGLKEETFEEEGKWKTRRHWATSWQKHINSFLSVLRLIINTEQQLTKSRAALQRMQGILCLVFQILQYSVFCSFTSKYESFCCTILSSQLQLWNTFHMKSY